MIIVYRNEEVHKDFRDCIIIWVGQESVIIGWLWVDSKQNKIMDGEFGDFWKYCTGSLLNI